MITERQAVGKIEVLEDGQLQLREDTVIERDGVEIARTYHRLVLAPGEFTRAAEKAQRVQDVAALIWTPEVIEAYEEKQRRAIEALPPPPLPPRTRPQ